MVIVSRHAALIEAAIEDFKLLRGEGGELRTKNGETVRVLPHADEADVRGEHVIGVLPLHLAAAAAAVTVPVMDVPLGLRGQELTLPQMRAAHLRWRTFEVREKGQ